MSSTPLTARVSRPRGQRETFLWIRTQTTQQYVEEFGLRFDVNPQRWSQVRIAFNAGDKEGVRLYGACGASASESCQIRDSNEEGMVGDGDVVTVVVNGAEFI